MKYRKKKNWEVKIEKEKYEQKGDSGITKVWGD